MNQELRWPQNELQPLAHEGSLPRGVCNSHSRAARLAAARKTLKAFPGIADAEVRRVSHQFALVWSRHAISFSIRFIQRLSSSSS
jgi:hypothetical protein